MLLKDCPVGSVVRLVSICGDSVYLSKWSGEFTVKKSDNGVYVTDGEGDDRYGVSKDPDFQFEIVHPAPEPAPEPRITFTVGGQEFYVGQRVWSLVNASGGEYEVKPRDEMEVSAMSAIKGQIVCRHIKTNVGAFCWPSDISTTPPAPHEWKRGDWARHEEFGSGFVYATVKGGVNDRIFVTFEDQIPAAFKPSELTFISHTKIPE